MITVPVDPADEARRLAAVRRYEILDTPPDGAFDRICVLAARAFGAPIASVTIVDEDRIWFKALRGVDTTEVPREPGLCASAIMQGGSYLIEDALRDPRALENALVRGPLGLRFYAAAPIVTHDGFRLGTVNVIDVEPRTATADQLRTLDDLAALVMDHMELRLSALRHVARERELGRRAREEKQRLERLASTLQRSLSPPRLPRIDGLELGVLFEPLADDVGGDFYDVFPLPGGWGFFCGDVCGKGAPAAARTSLARYTLRSAGLHEDDPAAAVRTLNEALRMEPDAPMCSVVYGRLRQRPGGGSVDASLVVAGHPPPLVLRADGALERLPAGGPILGAFADARFGTMAISLSAGDQLVLYTDGVTDAIIEGARIGEEGLVQALAPGGRAPAEHALARVGGLLERADRPLRDDVAVLAIRLSATPQPRNPGEPGP